MWCTKLLGQLWICRFKMMSNPKFPNSTQITHLVHLNPSSTLQETCPQQCLLLCPQVFKMFELDWQCQDVSYNGGNGSCNPLRDHLSAWICWNYQVCKALGQSTAWSQWSPQGEKSSLSTRLWGFAQLFFFSFICANGSGCATAAIADGESA